VVLTGPELGTLGERSDGSAQNLGQEPIVVYALVLAPAGPVMGTPLVTVGCLERTKGGDECIYV
jgi:hypothetical protein